MTDTITARSPEQLAAAMYPDAAAPSAPKAAPIPLAMPESTAQHQIVGTSRTESELAEALYGKPAPQLQVAETSDEPPRERSQEELADAIYSKPELPPEIDIPASVKAERAADPLRQLYSADMQFKRAIPDDTFAHMEGIPPVVQKAVVKELREMAADVGMSPDDAETMRGIGRSIIGEPTQEQRAAWQDEAVQKLNETYGQGAKQALRDAVKFINKDPRWVEMMESRGVGDNPQVVLLFAKLARQARVAGKLK